MILKLGDAKKEITNFLKLYIQQGTYINTYFKIKQHL